MLLFNSSSLVARSGDWEEVKMTLGEKIKHMRGVRGLTVRELGERVGLSGSMISHLENGDVKKPTAESIAAIARVLNVPVEYFLYDEARTPFQVLGSDMPADLAEFILSEKSMPYIRLAKEACDKEIPEEALRGLIAALRHSQKYRLNV